MNLIETNFKTFESIKHTTEYGGEYGTLENCKKHWSINNGEDLKKQYKKQLMRVV